MEIMPLSSAVGFTPCKFPGRDPSTTSGTICRRVLARNDVLNASFSAFQPSPPLTMSNQPVMDGASGPPLRMRFFVSFAMCAGALYFAASSAAPSSQLGASTQNGSSKTRWFGFRPSCGSPAPNVSGTTGAASFGAFPATPAMSAPLAGKGAASGPAPCLASIRGVAGAVAALAAANRVASKDRRRRIFSMSCKTEPVAAAARQLRDRF
mmetsp:Transcript_15499/g.47978  ORF Transcript_15499/g.47978 Transcript_15499/m.47978 type:complete len:209 (-) Transcript_15499:369-995(-)